MLKTRTDLKIEPQTERKISETILDLGAPLLVPLSLEMPIAAAQAAYELVVAVWNAHGTATPRWGRPGHPEILDLNFAECRVSNRHGNDLEIVLDGHTDRARLQPDFTRSGHWAITFSWGANTFCRRFMARHPWRPSNPSPP